MHRIGRTGRAGASGEALSLVCGEEREYLKSIEKLLGEKMPTSSIEGYEPSKEDLESTPIKGKAQKKSSRGGNSGRGSSNSNNSNRRRTGGGNANKNKSRRPRRD